MNILVQCMAGIGDTLLAVPIFAEIKHSYPDASMDALVMYPGSVDILKNNPAINEIFQINLLREMPHIILKKLIQLRFREYDVVICAHPQSRTAYRVIARIIGAPVCASHIYEISGWFDRFLVTHSVEQDYTLHTVENNRLLLSQIGFGNASFIPRLDLFLRPEEEAFANDEDFKSCVTQTKWIGVHLGSGSTKNLVLKRWPVERWVQLFDLIQLSGKHRVLLFGGPEERAIHSVIVERFPKLCRVAPTRNLREVGALMKRCMAFVSVDTALMHIAAAVEVCGQVVIEGVTLNPTNLPFRTSPYSIARNPEIKNRYLDYYRYDGLGIRASGHEMNRIMAGVTAEQVFSLLPT